MLYYVPSPGQAYSSTQYIFSNVSYGRFLETVHLYTAYAMIMLAFMHMMRGYFVSVHKKPREAMWLVGMIMGFITLGFGFTGYLLPWTVISKSATDVGIGIINALPPSLAALASFLVVGTGGDAGELLRFYDLHVVVLPAVLLGLLAVKMYLLETHGISDPVRASSLSDLKRKLIPIFPDASLYLMELAALFGAGMLIISLLFPLSLPPQYSPALAAQYTPQPDWYFLWVYQILKISAFETAGLTVALSAVTILFAALVLLPFIDRSDKRKIGERPVFITLGAIFVAELATLAYWGLVTPGQVISNEQAALIIGGIALLVAGVTFGVHEIVYSRAHSRFGKAEVSPSLRTAQAWTCVVFVSLVGLGSLAIGSSFDSLVQLITTGVSASSIGRLFVSTTGLAVVVLVSVYFLYRLDLGTGSVRRRVSAFEIGWEGDKA